MTGSLLKPMQASRAARDRGNARHHAAGSSQEVRDGLGRLISHCGPLAKSPHFSGKSVPICFPPCNGLQSCQTRKQQFSGRAGGGRLSGVGRFDSCNLPGCHSMTAPLTLQRDKVLNREPGRRRSVIQSGSKSGFEPQSGLFASRVASVAQLAGRLHLFRSSQT
jgi:hypothetical protein